MDGIWSFYLASTTYRRAHDQASTEPILIGDAVGLEAMGLRNTLKFGLRLLLVVAIYSIMFMVLMNYEHQDQNLRIINAIY